MQQAQRMRQCNYSTTTTYISAYQPTACSILNAHCCHGSTILAFQTKPADLNIRGDQAKYNAFMATSNAATLHTIPKTFIKQCMNIAK